MSLLRSGIPLTLRSARSVVGCPRLRYHTDWQSHLRRSITILALESSADDSCAAIVNSDRKILSNVVIKQHDINVRHGGIHPLEAQHAHERNVPRAIRGALDDARIPMASVDAVAYTRGPGMYNCIGVSAASAKALAAAYEKPLIGVHHMQAHALTPLLTEEVPPDFPFLVLLVSGGHTQLVLASNLDEFSILADTLDTKIGDAFDKAARLLDLPSSTQASGAVIEHYAALQPLPPFNTTPAAPLPSSIPEKSRVAFSFSGLLAATERRIALCKHEGIEDEAFKREMSRVFQTAVVGHLCSKVGHAIDSLHRTGGTVDAKLGGLVVSGGVASNQYLRRQLAESMRRRQPESPIPLYFPPISLCTDNAAMIAWTAILRAQANPDLLRGKGEGYDLPLRPRWSLEDLYDDVPNDPGGRAAKPFK